MKVRLGKDGPAFEAGREETVLAAAERAGVHLPFGCRSGQCGACRARLLAGEVDAGDSPALDQHERRAGLILLCQARPRADLLLQTASRQALAGQQLRVLPARVDSRRELNHDVLELGLRLPRTERLDYLPGQYLDILLRDGGRRSFSMANAPRADGRLELHLRRVPDGRFTPWAFTSLREGGLLRIEGPLGSFFLRDDPRPAVLVGGGTGIAPLKAMLESAEAAGREILLYWGVRGTADLYLHEWLEALAASRAGLRYVPVLSAPDQGWAGRSGFVHAAVAADLPDLSGHEVYMSGPPAMIAAGKAAFYAQGLAAEDLYYDAFDYAHVSGP